MAYHRINKTRSNHSQTLLGEPASHYSRYETGIIKGHHRAIPATIADSAGFDGMGFDASIDSADDNWYMANVFKDGGKYIDTIAIGGAMDADHAMQVISSQLDSISGHSAKLIENTGSTQFDSLNATDNGWSIDAISKLASNPSQNKHFLPIITASELETESRRVTFDSVQWGGEILVSHGGKDAALYLDMVRTDSRHELINTLNLNDELQALGAEEDSFDALMETKSRLGLLKDRLFNAMSRAGNADLSVTNVTETKPFKRGGVSNIAFAFDLSDGQTVSIWFHNPDSTPSKLMPSDIMISWKWMLNKRDVTAVLSPKHGDNVQLPMLASRILRVAAKNSTRFKTAQARKLQVEQELSDAQQLVTEKTAIIEQLDKDIESLTSQIDAAMKAPKVEPVIETSIVDDTVVEPASQEIDADNLKLELKGNELGEFEDTPEGKKQLRAAAKNEFNKLRGQWIACPSLSATEGENAKIEIRKRGIKEFMAFSGDSRKLKLVAKIAEIIKTATLSTNGWQDNEKLDKKPMVAGYYHLENKISIDGEIIELRVLIEKDQKGLLHYDVILPKHEAIFDNLEQKNVLETAIPDNYSGVASSTLNIKAPNDEGVNQDQAMFDKADLAAKGIVLNMFILNDTSIEDTQDNEVIDNSVTTEEEVVEPDVVDDELLDPSDFDDYDFGELFKSRHADKMLELGIEDEDIEGGEKGYEIQAGVLAGKSLCFADTLFKLNDAAVAVGADIAVADFTSTAYQNSMFDGLSTKSKPIYGITAQIAKGDAVIRASIDKKGDCEILMGGSGEDVNESISFNPNDNTSDYKLALERAFSEAEAVISTAEPTKGNVNNSTTVKGTKIKSVFALVESDSLIASHTGTGAKNPDFPQELQPRDRSDEKSVESIKENSKNLNPEKLGETSFVGNGAPIVGSDLIVESGNGRTIAIKTAYNNGDAGEYKTWLIENASKFGFTAEQVEGYQQPVLVRIRETEVDRIDFAIEANLDAYPKYFNQDTDTTTANEVPVNTTDNNSQASASTAIERLNAMQALAEDESIEPSNDFLDELTQIEAANAGDDTVAQKIEVVGKAYEKKLAKIAIKAMQDMMDQS